jgi:hypothetical protein
MKTRGPIRCRVIIWQAFDIIWQAFDFAHGQYAIFIALSGKQSQKTLNSKASV